MLRLFVEVFNLHLIKPCSLGNCLASFEERAVGAEEAVVASATHIGWVVFDEVHVHIFADVVNKKGGMNFIRRR